MRKIILCLVFPLLFTGCLKEDTTLEVMPIHVHGRVTDSYTDEPFNDFKLVVMEFNRESIFSPPGYTEEYIGNVGTVYTDQEGYYDLTFMTTGEGDTYYIYYDYENQDFDSVWTNDISPVKLDQDISNEVNFSFIHLYPATLIINTAPDLEYAPIGIGHYFTYPNLEVIEEVGTQSIREIAISKSYKVEVKFYRELPDETLQKAVFEFPPTNTTAPTEFEINLTNEDFE
ncbi:hypothetical protein [Flavobacterium alkalisoli]|uniref:hypothetical protein n=1 Tax=Flavobacterium alkalisoli TaxID=2602769 RepID=UPI003A8D7EE9